MPTTITPKLAEHHQFLVWLDERISQAELRRDYPPPGGLRSDPVVQEELRILYVSHAKSLQLIQHLQKDLPELDFSETFQSVLKTASMADVPATKNQVITHLSGISFPLTAKSNRSDRCIAAGKYPSR
ncbi:MAG TPA: hypothetical protein VNW30_11775 [Opitutaceae bacterium]|jgi:hypothetical protein|nr:hypothetical protein [Opitutaceae bacterium]